VNVSVIETALEKLRRAGAASTNLPDRAVIRPAARTVVTPEPVPVSTRVMPIDLARLRAIGYVPDVAEERRFADYYREIKRPLIHQAMDPHATADRRWLIVSSALPGEGKTFTTLNLALSMAREQDISVLLLDGDLPRASLSRTLGVQDEPGLLQALLDPAVDAESLVLRTDVTGLSLLPAGGATDSAAELLGSERMLEVAARLLARDPRRIVLLDCSPMLASTEARALLRVPSLVILVVRAGQTPQQALLDTLALMDRKKVHGLVLNDAYTRRGEGYYGYSGYGASRAQVDAPG